MAGFDPKSELESILNHLYRREPQLVKEKVSHFSHAPQPEWKPCNVLLNDAIHGPVELNSLLVKIIDTPEFQRLRHIKQLGGGCYVYPGATHQRFDHSIGVCHIAGVFGHFLKNQLDEVKEQRKWPHEELKFEKEEVLCIQIAGLCHDLGHGPFSHTFEQRVSKELPKHELLSLMVFDEIMKNPSVLAEFVYVYKLGLREFHLIKDMIHPDRQRESVVRLEGREKKEFLLEIIANKRSGIDVDKWDYFTRDCHYLGIAMDFQWKRCMLLGRICKHNSKDTFNIGFNKKELDNIYGMGRTRSTLHRKAYVHKTKVAVEEMFAAAMRKVIESDVPLISKWNPKKSMRSTDSVKEKGLASTDQEQQEGLLSLKEAIKKVARYKDIRWFLPLTDYSVITLVRNWEEYYEYYVKTKSANDTLPHQKSKELIREAVEMLNRIDHRQLYHLVHAEPVPKCRDSKIPDKDGKEMISWNVTQLMGKEKDKKKRRESDSLAREIFDNEDLQSVFVEVVSISFGSETKNDPVEGVLFYTANEPYIAQEKESDDDSFKASCLTLPEQFTEYEIRVYNTSKSNDLAFKEKLRAKFNTWKDTKLTKKDFFQI